VERAKRVFRGSRKPPPSRGALALVQHRVGASILQFLASCRHGPDPVREPPPRVKYVLPCFSSSELSRPGRQRARAHGGGIAQASDRLVAEGDVGHDQHNQLTAP